MIKDLTYEMKKMHMPYSWTEWNQMEKFKRSSKRRSSYIIVCSDEENHSNYVGFLVNKFIKNTILRCQSMNSKLIKFCLSAKPFNSTPMQIYVPTTDYIDDNRKRPTTRYKWLFKNNTFCPERLECTDWRWCPGGLKKPIRTVLKLDNTWEGITLTSGCKL